MASFLRRSQPLHLCYSDAAITSITILATTSLPPTPLPTRILHSQHYPYPSWQHSPSPFTLNAVVTITLATMPTLTVSRNSRTNPIFFIRVGTGINKSLYVGFLVLVNGVHERRDASLSTSAIWRVSYADHSLCIYAFRMPQSRV